MWLNNWCSGTISNSSCTIVSCKVNHFSKLIGTTPIKWNDRCFMSTFIALFLVFLIMCLHIKFGSLQTNKHNAFWLWQQLADMFTIIYMSCHLYCILRPAFGCCAFQTLVKIVILRILKAKSLKSKKFAAKFCKNTFFKVCTKTLVDWKIGKKTQKCLKNW